MLSVDQVARELNTSKMSIYRWVKQGKLKAFKFSGKMIRIAEEDLEKFLKLKEIKQ